VRTYEHLKDDKNLSQRLGDLENYFYLKDTTLRDDEVYIFIKNGDIVEKSANFKRWFTF